MRQPLEDPDGIVTVGGKRYSYRSLVESFEEPILARADRADEGHYLIERPAGYGVLSFEFDPAEGLRAVRNLPGLLALRDALYSSVALHADGQAARLGLHKDYYARPVIDGSRGEAFVIFWYEARRVLSGG